MIAASAIAAILAAACLLPSLYYGARQDLKEFRFSEIHFESLWINAAIVCTVMMYVCLIAEQGWQSIIAYLTMTIISWIAFSFIAFHFGNGGDWRAMMYVAGIAPSILINTIISIAVCGIVQAIIWLARTDIKIPPMFRKIPFAVSILCGYMIALGWFVVSGMG